MRTRTVAVLVLAGGCGMPLTGKERGKELYQTCVPCHAADGQGKRELNAPPIAGYESWYIEEQLKKFRSGARGLHSEDTEGMRMRPMALSIPRDEDLAPLAEYVSTLKPVAYKASVFDGDAMKGTEVYARCTQCHGSGGTGNAILKAPSLVGKADWYLLAQMKKFKAGIRGTSPLDTNGMLMRQQALGAFETEQQMKDAITHIQRLARP